MFSNRNKIKNEHLKKAPYKEKLVVFKTIT